MIFDAYSILRRATRCYALQCSTVLDDLIIGREVHVNTSQCVTVDADEDKCAAGDATGRLLIWHGFGAAVARSGAGDDPGQLPCTTVHWHAHPVGALAFSPDGNYLLSGGVESVLV